MRLYGGKLARRLVDDRTSRRQESRDAILWEIDGTVCRVKVQGSNEMIVAHYPRNQKQNPTWLRKGNAVRVIHRSGIRGYFEVIGEGRAIPSPVAGGSFPDIGGLSDGIMSGLVTRATDPASLYVTITSGSVRINDIIYAIAGEYVDCITMNTPAPMTMGTDPYEMGIEFAYLLGSGPASGWFRYDIIVVGINAVFDLIEGVAATSNPAIPATPADHVLVATILRVGGDATVTNADIKATWETPIPISFELVYDDEFDWDPGDNYPETNFQVNIKDQYGNAISDDDGWDLDFKMIVGTGDVWSLDSGYDPSEVSQNLVSLSTYTFRYRRDQTVTEISPTFQVILNSSNKVYGFGSIILLDAGGDPI